MKYLGIVCFYLFFLKSVYASTIRGILAHREDQQWFIDLGHLGQSPIVVRPVYQAVMPQLQKLRVGDLIQGRGFVTSPQSPQLPVLMLESIDFVGLRDLLGQWFSKEHMVVDFINFNQLKIYRSNQEQLYDYSIAPASEKGWMIFLQDPTSTSLGGLKMEAGNAVIEVYNHSAHSVLLEDKIELSRLPQTQ